MFDVLGFPAMPAPHPSPEFRSSAPSTVGATAGRRGFSLVEVTFGIGLIMFAALVIFSLLPVGLVYLQDSNRQIVETEIFNTVGAELASTPYEQLASYQSTRFPVYFNNEGIEVDADEDPIFTVRCNAPVAEAGGETSRMTVLIGFRRDPAGSDADGKVTKRTFLLVDRGI